MPPEVNKNDEYIDWEELAGNFPCYRFVMMTILAIVMIGNSMRLLTKYKVNYSFIFELDPRFKVTHIILFRVSLLLLTSVIGGINAVHTLSFFLYDIGIDHET